jgi:dTDP-4-dehydrorhamnose 3,5-epimerase-like enzyme
MNVIKTAIPEVFIFEPKVFGDARGFFFESFSQKIFEETVGKNRLRSGQPLAIAERCASWPALSA